MPVQLIVGNRTHRGVHAQAPRMIRRKRVVVGLEISIVMLPAEVGLRLDRPRFLRHGFERVLGQEPRQQANAGTIQPVVALSDEPRAFRGTQTIEGILLQIDE